jgi:hypothetical protein
MKLFASILIAVLAAASISFAEDAPAPAPEQPADAEKIKDPSTVKREKTYSVLEIFEQIRDKRLPKEDLVKLLGEPDYKGTHNGQEFWQYYNLTQHNKDKTKLWHQNFLFEGGKVSYDWVTKTAGPPEEKSAESK